MCCQNEIEVKIQLIENGKLPEAKSKQAACFDCYARLGFDYIRIPSKSRCLVNLGFAMEMPAGYEAVIRSRSGLSKQGVDVCVGTIDSDYRGEVKAIVVNNQDGEFEIKQGDRICQMAIRKCPTVKFKKVMVLSETERGNNGFGSSGTR